MNRGESLVRTSLVPHFCCVYSLRLFEILKMVKFKFKNSEDNFFSSYYNNCNDCACFPNKILTAVPPAVAAAASKGRGKANV